MAKTGEGRREDVGLPENRAGAVVRPATVDVKAPRKIVSPLTTTPPTAIKLAGERGWDVVRKSTRERSVQRSPATEVTSQVSTTSPALEAAGGAKRSESKSTREGSVQRSPATEVPSQVPTALEAAAGRSEPSSSSPASKNATLKMAAARGWDLLRKSVTTGLSSPGQTPKKERNTWDGMLSLAAQNAADAAEEDSPSGTPSREGGEHEKQGSRGFNDEGTPPRTSGQSPRGDSAQVCPVAPAVVETGWSLLRARTKPAAERTPSSDGPGRLSSVASSIARIPSEDGEAQPRKSRRAAHAAAAAIAFAHAAEKKKKQQEAKAKAEAKKKQEKAEAAAAAIAAKEREDMRKQEEALAAARQAKLVSCP
jgi:hypothetical protein